MEDITIYRWLFVLRPRPPRMFNPGGFLGRPSNKEYRLYKRRYRNILLDVSTKLLSTQLKHLLRVISIDSRDDSAANLSALCSVEEAQEGSRRWALFGRSRRPEFLLILLEVLLSVLSLARCTRVMPMSFQCTAGPRNLLVEWAVCGDLRLT